MGEIKFALLPGYNCVHAFIAVLGIHLAERAADANILLLPFAVSNLSLRGNKAQLIAAHSSITSIGLK